MAPEKQYQIYINNNLNQTIIQCLKFITTGTLPPNSDKGKSFIMDPKVAGKPEVIGDIRLIFKIGNRPILVKRRISVSSTNKGTKFQSIQQVLKTKNQNGQDLTINHQCAQIQKQVPHFLGISKSILQNITFCHQDESLWPFGDSNTLKGIFDQLFETKKFTDLMQHYWQEKKVQQAQLKQLKIRLEYQKRDFHKNMNSEKEFFEQLEQIELKSLDLKKVRKQAKRLKNQLKDNSQKVKQRQKLIYSKGTLEQSIRVLEQDLKKCKKYMVELNKNYRKNQNKNAMQIEEDNFMINYKGLNTSNKISDEQIQKIEIIFHKNPQDLIQKFQQGKQIYQQLVKNLNMTRDHLEMLKNYTQLNKRQRQIKSEIDRVKDILPEMKGHKLIKNDEDFLNVLKKKVQNMHETDKGIQLAKIKLEQMEIPNFVENGLLENEIQKCKKQYRQLQGEIKKISVVILRIYQVQFKSLSSNIDISENALKRYEKEQVQLKNIEAVIKSKQQQLQHFKSLPKKQTKDKNSIQQQINNYKYTGQDLQNNMMQFCQRNKKCYFCMRVMNELEIQNTKKHIGTLKKRTQMKICQLEKMKNQRQNQIEFVIDSQIMIRKIKDELKKLKQKEKILIEQVRKNQRIKQNELQYKKNQILVKQLSKCKLSMNVLQQLGYRQSSDLHSKLYYQEISMDQYKELCSQYLITLEKYKSIKSQLLKIEQNQQKNRQIFKKREEMIKQKQDLQNLIKIGSQQIKNYDFIKNSHKKLETLIKLNIKSKNKNKGKGNKQNVLQDEQKNSLLSSFNTIEQAQIEVDRLNNEIILQKYENQKFQIQIQYSTKLILQNDEKKKLKQVISELQNLKNQFQITQKIIQKYSQFSHHYEKQSEKYKNRINVINIILNDLNEKQYLINLRKIKNLEESIINIQLAYRALEESISIYHSEKMQQINRYIYQTWKEIYHGNDIEYIEIESSAQKDAKKRKKNYFYRILMKKNTKNFKNTEKVQMKGRCSMGQKVLASIVIRLALAQVFCSRTRILALDQPTTNLDKEHINNLAIALLRLIQLSGAKNLQLIIISHDIEFIKMLEEYADCCFEISRDEQKFSHIQKKQIKDIYTS